MPIKLPDLDNKTFDDLLGEMKASIPTFTKEWTNFNPSDPGITILELLSWICETMIYRSNIIPEESYLNFARLVAGTERVCDVNDLAHQQFLDYLDSIEKGGKVDVHKMKAEVQNFLNSRYRAVTLEDFEELALEASDEIERVFVFQKNEKVWIIFATQSPGEKDLSIIKAVREHLIPRKLIGTAIRVREAKYTPTKLLVDISCESYSDVSVTEDRVRANITNFLDAIKGGPDGDGWPFGRDIMVYELYHLIEKTEGVDHVVKIADLSGGVEREFTKIKIEELPVLEYLEIR
jgi:hypothetical protein